MESIGNELQWTLSGSAVQGIFVLDNGSASGHGEGQT